MITIGQIIQLPWGFPAQVLSFITRDNFFDNITLRILAGPATGAILKVAIIARETELPSKNHRVRMRITEGPEGLVGMDRWMSVAALLE